jgi:hypothetical protein
MTPVCWKGPNGPPMDPVGSRIESVFEYIFYCLVLKHRRIPSSAGSYEYALSTKKFAINSCIYYYGPLPSLINKSKHCPPIKVFICWFLKTINCSNQFIGAGKYTFTGSILIRGHILPGPIYVVQCSNSSAFKFIIIWKIYRSSSIQRQGEGTRTWHQAVIAMQTDGFYECLGVSL